MEKQLYNIKRGTHGCKPKKRYFTQFTCEEKAIIPQQKPDIAEVVSVIVEPEIISLRVINTVKGTSCEGQHLTGKKLSAEIKLKQKIMYISIAEVQSVHVVENECMQSIFIVIPKTMEGTRPEDLLKYNFLKTNIYVENATAVKMDARTIFKNIVIFMEVRLMPCYSLCYSETIDCHKSSLYLVHEDGTKCREIACFENYIIENPKWGQCGQRIAFICYDKCNENNVLCVTGINSPKVKELTDPYILNNIGNFSWNVDGNVIFFDAYFKDKSEIFSVNVNNLQWKQLTYSECGNNNCNPKCSPNGQVIAYLKEKEEYTDLYTMKNNGIGTKQITLSSYIKDFDWYIDNIRIAYISNKCEEESDIKHTLGIEKKGNEIYIIDTVNYVKKSLKVSKLNLKIRNINFSPDGLFLAFIGRNLDTYDIYVYNLQTKEIHNITNNNDSVRINDFAWKADSDEIYYSANELGYYNLYNISICDKISNQISNTTASSMEVSYRTKLI